MGAIINIFKNIIGLITGLFSGKKGKNGFFLEAPAVKEAPAVAPAAVATTQAAVTKAAPAAAPAPPAAKKAKGKAGKAVAAATAVAATVAAAPAMPSPAELFVPGSPTFAEMNAVPMSTASRRRPGVNMTGFLDMAKTIKSGR
jgi:hypothetical protein